MQELRSTDILDKEILSDSRRKAEKILKNSDSECKELLDSLDSEIQKAKLEKQEIRHFESPAFEIKTMHHQCMQCLLFSSSLNYCS